MCINVKLQECDVCVPQVEALLASEDYGKDLASVNNLLKKHQLLEADISAHEVRPSVTSSLFKVSILEQKATGQPLL